MKPEDGRSVDQDLPIEGLKGGVHGGECVKPEDGRSVVQGSMVR